MARPSEIPSAAPAARPSLEDSRWSPLVLWIAIRKHWIIVVATTLAVSLMVTFYTLGQKRIYECSATVLFDPQPPRPLGNQVLSSVDFSGEYWSQKEYYKTQYWVIQSQRISSVVVKALGLNKDAAFLDNAPSNTKPPPRTVSVEDAARILRSRLSVEPIRDSRLALVSYKDADPVRAPRVLSALVDTYAQGNLDDALEAMDEAGDWLGSQVTSLKAELESNEMALHGYKKDKNILSVSMDDQSNMVRGEIQQLNTALTDAKTRRARLEARRSELLKISPQDPSSIPATELLTSQLLQGLRAQFLEAKAASEALIAQGKGAHHPEVLSVLAREAATKQALMAEVVNIQGSVSHDFNVSSREVSGLEALVESARQRALDLNLLEIEYNRLKRGKDNSEKLYGIVTERAKENDLTRMLRFNNIRVVDRPLQPRTPVTPNIPVNVATGIALGLLLGLAGAVGREQLDGSLKTPEDVEQELGLPFLGLLPMVGAEGGNDQPYGGRQRRKRKAANDDEHHLGPRELVVHNHPTSGIAEAARAVRTNIMFMSPDKPYRTLLVTSAAPSEGKTTVACCIAIALAQAGKRVVLIDCDMRRPRIHRVFNVSNEVGVTAALLSPELLDDAIKPTVVPNLSIVTTGTLPPNPAELLHTDAFDRLLRELQSRFDCVLIDSPPIAPVTDATVLSTRVDGTVLVTRAFQTRKDVARRATRSVSDVGGRLVGVVLNAVDFSNRQYGSYGHYYYRRYGYGPEGDAPPKAAE